MASDSAEAFAGIDGNLLLTALLVVIVILLLSYRSPTLWVLPVVSAGVALISAQGLIYLSPTTRAWSSTRRARGS